jgi:hypothetical protein
MCGQESMVVSYFPEIQTGKWKIAIDSFVLCFFSRGKEFAKDTAQLRVKI